MNGSVLITGGAGFIGFHLARSLVNFGHRVHLVDNHARGRMDKDLQKLLAHPSITFSRIDLMDYKSLSKLGNNYSAVYHLAAIIGVSHVSDRPYEVLVNNIRMLENIIRFTKIQQHFQRLFYASTSEVYAGALKHFDLEIPSPESASLAVTDLSDKRTTYMMSKITGEAMCHHSGVPFTIFRPHNIYGPRMGMAHVIPEQLQNIWDAGRRSKVGVYSVDHRRTFCYIDDAVEMLIRMLTNKLSVGQTLNIGTESPEVTIREVVEICIEVAKKNITIEALPPTPGSPTRRAPNMLLTKQLLKYESATCLREGITKTWKWYKANVFDSSQASAS